MTAETQQPDLSKVVVSTRMHEDPYPIYERLLDEPGWVAPSGYAVFARYADVMAILRNPAVFGQERLHYPNFHVTDPPEHTRLRSLVTRAFTPRAISQQHEQIQRWVVELVNEAVERGTIDFTEDFARRLPGRVIAEMLGVPVSDAKYWRQWMDDIHVLRGDIRFRAETTTDQQARDTAAAGAASMANYFSDLIAERRHSARRDDLVAGLLDARDNDDRLSEEEVLYTLGLLLGAGLETTSYQLGNTMRALAERPGTWRRLREDRSAVPLAVDEALRVEGTLQAEYRVAKDDVSVGGADVEAGRKIIILNAAANRDPGFFPEPQEFRPGRENANQHLTFGWGIHRCLGAQLARTELVIAFEQLIDRVEEVELAGEPELHPYNRLRGLRHLPVRFVA
jgi:cytochrome P450